MIRRKKLLAFLSFLLIFALLLPMWSVAEQTEEEPLAAEEETAAPAEAPEEPFMEEPEEPEEILPAEEPEKETGPKPVEAKTDGEETNPLKRIPDPVFVILEDWSVLYLSIGEAELREVVAFFREEMHLNDAAIAGIIANLECESQLNPNKVGDRGFAYGLCQWRGNRLDAMVDFCDRNGLNPVTMEGQLSYLKEELETSHQYAGDILRDVEDNLAGALWATWCFCAYYEVPGDVDAEAPERERLTELLIYPVLNEWSEAR